MKLKRLAIALCATVVCCGSVFAQTNTLKATPSVKIKNSSPNLTWTSTFPFYVRNDTNQTLTNIDVDHYLNAWIEDDHTIASLKPGQKAGPFLGTWDSTTPDYWTLNVTWPGSSHPNNTIVMGGKQCSIEPSDVEHNPSAVFVVISGVSSYYAENLMDVWIVPPVSSSCESSGNSNGSVAKILHIPGKSRIG